MSLSQTATARARVKGTRQEVVVVMHMICLPVSQLLKYVVQIGFFTGRKFGNLGEVRKNN